MAAAWTLVTCMLLSLVLTYASVMTIIQTVQDNTERALDSFVTVNSRLIYKSLKNGSDFTESLNEFYYNVLLSEGLSLDLSGYNLYNKDGQGNVVFEIRNSKVRFDYTETLKLRASYEIAIPIRFAGKQITNLKIPQTVSSYYNLKGQ